MSGLLWIVVCLCCCRRPEPPTTRSDPYLPVISPVRPIRYRGKRERAVAIASRSRERNMLQPERFNLSASSCEREAAWDRSRDYAGTFAAGASPLLRYDVNDGSSPWWISSRNCPPTPPQSPRKQCRLA